MNVRTGSIIPTGRILDANTVLLALNTELWRTSAKVLSILESNRHIDLSTIHIHNIKNQFLNEIESILEELTRGNILEKRELDGRTDVLELGDALEFIHAPWITRTEQNSAYRIIHNEPAIGKETQKIRAA